MFAQCLTKWGEATSYREHSEALICSVCLNLVKQKRYLHRVDSFQPLTIPSGITRESETDTYDHHPMLVVDTDTQERDIQFRELHEFSA